MWEEGSAGYVGVGTQLGPLRKGSILVTVWKGKMGSGTGREMRPTD